MTEISGYQVLLRIEEFCNVWLRKAPAERFSSKQPHRFRDRQASGYCSRILNLTLFRSSR